MPLPRVWFTSDTHFCHTNIIDYANRPFRGPDLAPDVQAMNRALVENWNARVQPLDIVYHLGDFAMGPRTNIHDYRKKLNGRIILVRGNHDRSRTAMLGAGFDEVHDHLNLTLDGVRLKLRHRPPPQGQRTFTDLDWFLCGHVHCAWNWSGQVINVGVDVRTYRPQSLEELLADTKFQRIGSLDDDD